jgi:hypothetical protein
VSDFDFIERGIAGLLSFVTDEKRGAVVSAALHRVQRIEDRARRLGQPEPTPADISAADATAELDAQAVAGELDQFTANALRRAGLDEATIALQLGSK